MANVNDLYELRVYCTLGDQTAINVYHLLITAKGGSGATDTQLGNYYDTQIATPYKNLLPVGGRYNGLTIQKISPLPALNPAIIVASAGAGTVASDALPRQVCGMISMITGFSGRRYRGRAYIPFPTESDNDANGQPNAGYITRLAALSAGLGANATVGTPPNTNTTAFVVRSKTFSLATPVVDFLERARWGTQRKRGDYGQKNVSPI